MNRTLRSIARWEATDSDFQKERHLTVDSKVPALSHKRPKYFPYLSKKSIDEMAFAFAYLELTVKSFEMVVLLPGSDFDEASPTAPYREAIGKRPTVASFDAECKFVVAVTVGGMLKVGALNDATEDPV